ncbi:ERAD-associated protein [Metarhizium acridum]|uniref:ERAD-associated protein n=1 Tax=Metarhizium acridum TaxID=92637 RepID=UPI001C6C97EE|nr:ERAD-associated protein [Metarhizium acridum]
MAVAARDVIYTNGDYIYVPWWHTKTGIIVRWVIFLVIFVLIMGYLIGGYYHAKARIRKGLEPLAYHRCLVSVVPINRPTRSSGPSINTATTRPSKTATKTSTP